ncbi:MAG: ribonuclease Z [Chloroflexota bacterium]
MFKIVFLGTSASAPSVQRGLSSQIVIHDKHRFLIDCGEGTQRQILKSGLGFKRLNRILITHGHLDHILGLAGLLSTFSRWETIDELEIFGGGWALERIHDLLFGVVLRGGNSPITIHLREIQPGIIFQTQDFSVSAFPVSHRGPDCFGFLFEEKEHRPFLSDLAEALGIPEGPWRRDLVNNQTVILPDGRQIHPDHVLGEPKPGTRLVHVGDAAHTENLTAFCERADALIIEATYLRSEMEMAQKYAHLTAHQAASLASQSNVHQLILTHISRRYRERDVLAEAQDIFPNTTVARDLDVFHVRRGECLQITEEAPDTQAK